jgi:hypothetical protein
MYSGYRNRALALAPKGFEDLSPRQFAEREADMATSNAPSESLDCSHSRGAADRAGNFQSREGAGRGTVCKYQRLRGDRTCRCGS